MHKCYFNKFKVPTACFPLKAGYDSHIHCQEWCAAWTWADITPSWISVQAVVALTAKPFLTGSKRQGEGKREGENFAQKPRSRVSNGLVGICLSLPGLSGFLLYTSTTTVACAVLKKRISPCNFSLNNVLSYHGSLNIYMEYFILTYFWHPLLP